MKFYFVALAVSVLSACGSAGGGGASPSTGNSSQSAVSAIPDPSSNTNSGVTNSPLTAADFQADASHAVFESDLAYGVRGISRAAAARGQSGAGYKAQARFILALSRDDAKFYNFRLQEAEDDLDTQLAGTINSGLYPILLSYISQLGSCTSAIYRDASNSPTYAFTTCNGSVTVDQL
jgi:hypothetical protein